MLLLFWMNLTLSAAFTCHGQGTIRFSNNYGTTYAPISYAMANVPTGKEGLLVGGEFMATLYFGLGTITDPALLTSSGINEVFGRSQPPLPGPPVPDGSPAAGFFDGGLVGLPPYSSGPVTFMVVAWKATGQYAGANYSTSQLRGASPLFTLPGLNPGVNELGPGFQSFTVQIVPEPCVIALAELSSGALLVSRRRR